MDLPKPRFLKTLAGANEPLQKYPGILPPTVQEAPVSIFSKKGDIPKIASPTKRTRAGDLKPGVKRSWKRDQHTKTGEHAPKPADSDAYAFEFTAPAEPPAFDYQQSWDDPDRHDSEFAKFVDAVRVGCAGFEQFARNLCVVQGWDVRRSQATSHWYHLQFVDADEDLRVACHCPIHHCFRKRLIRESHHEGFFDNREASSQMPYASEAPVYMFSSRERIVDDMYKNIFSVTTNSASTPMNRAIVMYEGTDTGPGRWTCTKDSTVANRNARPGICDAAQERRSSAEVQSDRAAKIDALEAAVQAQEDALKRAKFLEVQQHKAHRGLAANAANPPIAQAQMQKAGRGRGRGRWYGRGRWHGRGRGRGGAQAQGTRASSAQEKGQQVGSADGHVSIPQLVARCGRPTPSATMQHPAVITKAKAAAVAQVASKQGNKNASSGGTLTGNTASDPAPSVAEKPRKPETGIVANWKARSVSSDDQYQCASCSSNKLIEGEDAFVEGGLIDQELENGEEVAEGKEVVGQVKEQLYYADARSSKQRVTSGRPKLCLFPRSSQHNIHHSSQDKQRRRYRALQEGCPALYGSTTPASTDQARLHLLLGTLETWKSQDDGHIAESDDLLPTLRRNSGKTAPNILQGIVVPNGLGDNNNTEKRAERCKWALSGEEGCQPFLFANFSEDEEGVQKRTGLFQATIIIAALATHMSRISPLPESERSVTYPSGALFLSIQTARHAIKLHRSGELDKSSKGTTAFSQTNCGDRMERFSFEPLEVRLHVNSTNERIVTVIHVDTTHLAAHLISNTGRDQRLKAYRSVALHAYHDYFVNKYATANSVDFLD
ncbi:hypothetical protein NP233_g83 [Leucocoprinus birnbaumii]|uniref:Uncharacterized protein n=1 Tax=Leucocoprinus birnbaumii TaxID=56174 RepID=A0AAD5W2P4_9AGAR|nr:hypothetical protein NP233_g83 [Leucocoprinus birnbaumii]